MWLHGNMCQRLCARWKLCSWKNALLATGLTHCSMHVCQSSLPPLHGMQLCWVRSGPGSPVVSCMLRLLRALAAACDSVLVPSTLAGCPAAAAS